MAAYPPPTRKTRTRWVGRSTILPGWPAAPQWVRFLALTLCFVGVQLLWSCEMAQASPYLLSLGLSKSAMSVVFVAGPLSGLIVQPLVGVLSDSCRSSLGRRRPFIIGGCIVSSLAVMLLGWAREVAAMFTTTGGAAHARLTITFAILSIYLIDFSVNVVQAMDRALLVDLVQPHLQADANAWASRLFGCGAVAGYFIGGLDLVYLSGGLLGSEQLKVLTLFTAFFLCATHTVTVCSVTERVLISKEEDDQQEGLSSTKLAMENIWRTLRTLPRPMQQVMNVQFASWLGWFPSLFFSSTWVAEVFTKNQGGTDLASAPPAMQELATRAGSRALLLNSLVSLTTSIILPILVAPTETHDGFTHSPPTSYSTSLSPFLRNLQQWMPILPLPWLSLPLLWTISNGAFSLLLLSTYFATNVTSASLIIAGTGFSWALTNWLPFAILGDLILRMGSATPLRTSEQLWDAPSHLHLPDDHSAHSSPRRRHSDKFEPSVELHSLKINARKLHPRQGSPTLSDTTDMSETYFDVDPDTPVQATFAKSLHPYGSKGRDDSTASSEHSVDPFSSTASFHLEPYSSVNSLGHDPYSSSSATLTQPVHDLLHGDGSGTTVLQIRHSDSFDYDDEAVRNAMRRETAGLVSDRGMRSGVVPAILLGDPEDNEEAEDEGGDQAGVILGCHNIYLVLPQFIVTAFASVVFALLAPHHSVVGAAHGTTPVSSEDPLSSAPLVVGELVRLVVRASANDDWDALGLIFRLGGVAAAVSTWLCWSMTRDMERDRLRRLRGTE